MGKLLWPLMALMLLVVLTGCDPAQASTAGSGPPSCSDKGVLQGDLGNAPDGLKQAADGIAGALLDANNVKSSDINCAVLLALARHATNFGRDQSGHATSGCGVPDSVVKQVDTANLEPGGQTMTELGISNEPRTICDWVDAQGNFGFLHYQKGSWDGDAAKAVKQIPDAFSAAQPDPYNPDDAMMVAAVALLDSEKGGKDRKSALSALVGGGQAGNDGASAVLDLVSKSGFESAGSPGGGGGGTNAACAGANNCTPQGFADALLGYPGVNAPVNAANEHAIQAWERAEGGNWNNGASGNPLNTTQREPGSTSMNGVGVQAFHDAAGHTYWYWGIKANGDTLLNGHYGAILAVLKSPDPSPQTQCRRLAGAVATSPWGTSNFSGLC
jgi:hypothetical protein